MPPKKVFSYSFSASMIVALVFIIYSNTFQSPWLLDDFHNVVDNPRIQITDLSFENIKGSLFSSLASPDKLFRPVACLSFALNAFFCGKNVFGYHLVNISLHASTSLLLMWLLILVFKTPALKNTPDREKHFIIILSTILWAVNPVQIQAITYIVQRMAALCAFFSITSLGFFLKARLSETKKKQILFSICSAAGFTCAFFSKENGITTLFLMFIFEFLLFRNGDYKLLVKKKIVLLFIIFIILTGCLFAFSTSLSYLEELYEKRAFTLYDRLLTQPKILLYYLSLIFYPLPHRLSIEHEIIISTGIFTPPSTICYIIMVISSFCACIFLNKIPLLIRLGILFYLTAHSVESSILPLEMVFEHRNYLPSVFLFPPLAAGLYHAYDHFKSRKRHLMVVALIFFITTVIFLTSLATYTRNFDWRSDKSLWLDAINKAPGHARPKQSMGFVIGMNNPEKALNYYSSALTGYMHDPKDEKASTLANIGLIYFHQQNYLNARHFFKLALETDNNHQVSYYYLIQTFMKKGAWQDAISLINKKTIRENWNAVTFKRLKAVSLMQTGDYESAIDLFRTIYQSNPEDQIAILNIAELLSLGGDYKNANLLYNIYIKDHPNEPHIYLRKSKNYFLSGDLKKASESITVFFKITGTENVANDIRKFTTNFMLPLIGIEKMALFFENEFEIYKNNFKLSNNINKKESSL